MSGSAMDTGELWVTIESKLDHYCKKKVPVEVRDADLLLLFAPTHKRTFTLAAGLYQLSAVLEDGKRATRTVSVICGQTVEVVLEPDIPKQPTPSSKDGDYLSMAQLRLLQRIQPGSTLLDTSDNVSVYEVENHWIVRHVETMSQVPMVTLKMADSVLQISLPISDGHHYSPTCQIKRHPGERSRYPQVNISNFRGISAAMERMLQGNLFEAAQQLASNALTTLVETFFDPCGATLAALILHKTGGLESQQPLLEALVARSAWLPDGKILLAVQLARKAHTRELALTLACEASEQRILFTESYCLLMDLLRYWPKDSSSENQRNALTRLSKLAPFVEWDSTYFCNRSVESVDVDAAAITRT